MTEALAVRTDEGEARWWLGALAIIKATAADTRGSLTILEVTDPPGVKAPMHVHHREDEAFWVLEGEVTFEVGGKTIEARAQGTSCSVRATFRTAMRWGRPAPECSLPSPRAASKIWSERRAIRLPPAPSRRKTIQCPMRSR